MPSEEELDRAAAILRSGHLVAIPTETVYGLAANALDREAVRRIFKWKGRPLSSPLIVHVASLEMARSLAREWPPEAGILAGAFWPGPLTLVLPKQPIVPDEVTAGLDTVGIRMPSHPVALELIRRTGLPLAAPSANQFTQLSPTTAAHVRQAFGDSVVVVDGGACEVGIESTVVALRNGEVTVLRPGMIAVEAMEALLGRTVHIAGSVEGPHPSPGMHHRHYSPRTRVVLVAANQLPEGAGAYLHISEPQRSGHNMAMPSDPAAYAQRLYQVLHAADALALDWIAIELPPQTPEWAAIHDRLRRAAN
ncbi:MAG: threonylcarbamoyl-AMP synthase [Acidobacteria bacterium]|nr:threonylcarbamoyl-AMP synthase [Acidobacteriota bacterium]